MQPAPEIKILIHRATIKIACSTKWKEEEEEGGVVGNKNAEITTTQLS